MEDPKIYFKNIKEEIITQLSKAETDIFIAVAWLTEKSILQRLLEIQKRGVKISVLIYKDKINRVNLYEKLYHNGAEINFSLNLMHNKFCVIDRKILINGSYNWTNNASRNHENIQIFLDNENLAKSYITEFTRIQEQSESISKRIPFTSLHLTKKINDFKEYYLSLKPEISFPYIINVEGSNKESAYLPDLITVEGFYIIDSVEAEKNFYWRKFFYNTKIPHNTLKSYRDFEFKKIPFFNDILNYNIFPIRTNFYKMAKGKALAIETRDPDSEFLCEIDTEGKKIETFYFTQKLNNGNFLKSSYHNDSEIAIVDLHNASFKIRKINARVIKYSPGLGIVASLYNRGYRDDQRVGILDENGQPLTPFIYKSVEIKNDKEFIFCEDSLFKKDNSKSTLSPNSDGTKKLKYSFLENKWTKYFSSNYEKTEYVFYSDFDKNMSEIYLLLRKKFVDYPVVFNNGFSFETINNYFTDLLDEIKEVEPYYALKGLQSRLEQQLKIQEAFKSPYKENKNCYIATFIYQDPDHPKIVFLRWFRDSILVGNFMGRIFTKAYYYISPSLVRTFSNSVVFKYFFNFLIEIFIIIANFYITLLKSVNSKCD